MENIIYKPKIEIKTDGTITKIFVDGHQIRGVRRLQLEQEVGEVPVLTLDLNALNLSADGNFVMRQFGMGDITDISFSDTPNKDFIFSKVAEISGINEDELREKVLSEWKTKQDSNL